MALKLRSQGNSDCYLENIIARMSLLISLNIEKFQNFLVLMLETSQCNSLKCQVNAGLKA